MKIKIEVLKEKGREDSFWYNGDIAYLTKGDKEVLLIANGDIRIIFPDGQDFKDSRAVEEAEFLGYKDKDLKKLQWENNNWFECLYKYKDSNTWEHEGLMGNVSFDYDNAIQFAKDVLTSEDYKQLWERN